MQSSDESFREWIHCYMKPQVRVNHMYTATSLRLMAEEDTHLPITDAQFKRLMVDEGFPPSNRLANDDWEFRIASAPLRMRPKAKVGGWLPSMDPYNIKRLR